MSDFHVFWNVLLMNTVSAPLLHVRPMAKQVGRSVLWFSISPVQVDRPEIHLPDVPKPFF